MNLTLKTAATVVAAILPISLVSPAFAVDYDRLNITLDCTVGETGEDDHVIKPGEVLTVTFVNCDGLTIADQDDTGNATMPDNTVLDSTDTQLVSGNSFAITVVGEADLEVDESEDVDVYVAGTIDDPTSTLLATEEVSLELSAPETMLREEMIGDTVADDGSGHIYIDGDESCMLEPGLHVYTTLEFQVTVAGTYDFRGVAVSPIDEDLNWGVDKYPSSDPFVALYGTFNPALPETDLVGCNDDQDVSGITEIDDAWNGYEGMVTESGVLVEDQWPWFRTTLEPGNYTLVYLPFSTMGSTDFNLGQFAATSPYNPTFNPELVWEPTAQKVTYEMWGPEGGITFGDELAPTGGVNPSFAVWSGLALACVGVSMAVARRRELHN